MRSAVRVLRVLVHVLVLVRVRLWRVSELVLVLLLLLLLAVVLPGHGGRAGRPDDHDRAATGKGSRRPGQHLAQDHALQGDVHVGDARRDLQLVRRLVTGLGTAWRGRGHRRRRHSRRRRRCDTTVTSTSSSTATNSTTTTTDSTTSTTTTRRHARR